MRPGCKRHDLTLDDEQSSHLCEKQFKIDEVPSPCGLVANFCGLTIGFAVLVGPGRAADKIRRGQLVLVGGEQRIDFVFHRRLESAVGDDTDDSVT